MEWVCIVQNKFPQMVCIHGGIHEIIFVERDPPKAVLLFGMARGDQVGRQCMLL